MKSYKNLYIKLCFYENIYLAYKKARKHKTKKFYVLKFEENIEQEIKRLKQELEYFTYKPKPLKKFIIRDPKTRTIHSSHFRDRIIHHALINIIEPLFDKTFICDSYANRIGKGTIKAIERFDYFKRKVSKNGHLIKNALNNNQIQGYVLKADIKHYFNTIDHNLLIKIIKRKIKDKKVICIIKKILNNFLTKNKGKGMPLGNLTSQFFANVYLNELDYYIKYNLKAKYYIRYVDDFILLHHSKDQLDVWKKEINRFLNKNLLIELHKEKSKIIPLAKGLDFLGFRNFYYYKLLRKRNIRKFININNKINYDKIYDSLEGWFAYAKKANTHKLRKEISEYINKTFNKDISAKEINLYIKHSNKNI